MSLNSSSTPSKKDCNDNEEIWNSKLSKEDGWRWERSSSVRPIEILILLLTLDKKLFLFSWLWKLDYDYKKKCLSEKQLTNYFINRQQWCYSFFCNEYLYTKTQKKGQYFNARYLICLSLVTNKILALYSRWSCKSWYTLLLR